MKSKETWDTSAIINRIAYNNGITPEDVRRDMDHAIDIAMESNDARAKENMERLIGHKGRPTLEEFMMAVIKSACMGNDNPVMTNHEVSAKGLSCTAKKE